MKYKFLLLLFLLVGCESETIKTNIIQNTTNIDLKLRSYSAFAQLNKVIEIPAFSETQIFYQIERGESENTFENCVYKIDSIEVLTPNVKLSKKISELKNWQVSKEENPFTIEYNCLLVLEEKDILN